MATPPWPPSSPSPRELEESYSPKAWRRNKPLQHLTKLKTRHSAAITCNYTIQDFPFWKLQRYIMPNGKIKDSRAIFGRSCHILSWGTNYYWSGPAIILSPWTNNILWLHLSPISCLDKICPPLLCLDKIFLPYILCPDKICLPYCALTHSDQNLVHDCCNLSLTASSCYVWTQVFFHCTSYTVSYIHVLIVLR